MKKPFHPSNCIDYKELWREPFATDDRGEKYSLVSYESWNHIESVFENGRKVGAILEKEHHVEVMCDSPSEYSNGVVFPDTKMYFRSILSAVSKGVILKDNLCYITMRGYDIIPVVDGRNAYFKEKNGKNDSLNIRFDVCKVIPEPKSEPERKRVAVNVKEEKPQDVRNCRCCFNGYVKSTDDSEMDDEFFAFTIFRSGRPLEPVGFCCECDKGNLYYEKDKKCHSSPRLSNT